MIRNHLADASSPVAVVQDLTVKRGRNLTVLDGVSLTLSSGVTGVLGPNGAGKTTLFRVLVGLQRMNRGRVVTRQTVGYLPQDMRVVKSFTAAEILTYVGWVKGFSTQNAHSETRRCLELVGMSEHAASKVRTLSGGMQQRLVIATAFVGDPELVVLDEPTVGLDLTQQQFFRALVLREAANRSLLISSHVAADIVRTCSQVVVLDYGRLLFHGSLLAFGELELRQGEGGQDSGGEDDVSRFESRYLRLLDEATPRC